MADWNTFDLSDVLKGVDELEKLQDVIDPLIAVGNVAITTLEILQAFLVQIPNPINSAISILLNELQTIIDNLQESGAFGLFLIPTNLEELRQYRGGYRRFVQLFTKSLYDVEDPNRPQIGANGYLGGLFLFISKDSAADFIRQALALTGIFSTVQQTPKFPAPINVTAEPADSDGATPDSLINVFTEDDDLTTLVLSWEEPKYTQDVFYDFFSSNKFYLERSKSREGTLLTRTKTEKTKTTPVESRRDREAQIREPILDSNGAPIFVWEPALNTNDPFIDLDSDDLNDPNVSTNFIAGTYSLIVRGLEKGIENGYYYRVRSVPTDTELEEIDTGPEGGESIHVLTRNGTVWEGSQPSAPVLGYLPDVDTTFDMPTALLNVYRAAYVLRFDTQVQDLGAGTTLIGSETIDPPVPESIVTADSGVGEADFELLFDPILIDEEEGEVNAYYLNDNLFDVDEGIPAYAPSRRLVATKGLVTSTQTLEDDPFSGAREMFEGKFGLSPKERFRLFIDKVAIQKIKEILPTIVQNENLFELVKGLYEDNEADIEGLLVTDENLDDFIKDPDIRGGVFQIISLIDGFEQLGAPPNWQSIRFLEDLIPEADTILDRLFRILKSFDNVFSDAASALDGTIEGFRNRMAILNEIVDVLDLVIEFFAGLEALDFSVSVLLVPPDVGGTNYLVNELNNAGDPPDTDPDDYSGGVVLAFGGAGPNDATSIVNAIRFIFGL